MNTDKFAQQLQDVRWRVAELQGHPHRSPLQQQSLLLAFEECQTTLEELYVAEEELLDILSALKRR